MVFEFLRDKQSRRVLSKGPRSILSPQTLRPWISVKNRNLFSETNRSEFTERSRLIQRSPWRKGANTFPNLLDTRLYGVRDTGDTSGNCFPIPIFQLRPVGLCRRRGVKVLMFEKVEKYLSVNIWESLRNICHFIPLLQSRSVKRCKRSLEKILCPVICRSTLETGMGPDLHRSQGLTDKG